MLSNNTCESEESILLLCIILEFLTVHFNQVSVDLPMLMPSIVTGNVIRLPSDVQTKHEPYRAEDKTCASMQFSAPCQL